jgi:hypothetical protein
VYNNRLRSRGAGFQAGYVGFPADVPSQVIGLPGFQRDIFQYFIAKYPHPETPGAAGHNARPFLFSVFSST